MASQTDFAVEQIDELNAKRLRAASFLVRAVVQSYGTSYLLRLDSGDHQPFLLVSARQPDSPRQFRTIDAAVNAASRIGFKVIEVRL